MIYKTVRTAYRVDEKSIRDTLFEICQSKEEREQRIVLQSELLHRISKKVNCTNYRRESVEKDKTLMTIKGTVLGQLIVDYVIYAFPNEYGVDTEIEEIFCEGVSIYRMPEYKNEAILLY